MCVETGTAVKTRLPYTLILVLTLYPATAAGITTTTATTRVAATTIAPGTSGQHLSLTTPATVVNFPDMRES